MKVSVSKAGQEGQQTAVKNFDALAVGVLAGGFHPAGAPE